MRQSNGSRPSLRLAILEGNHYYDSPVGILVIKSIDDHITVINFNKEKLEPELITPVIEHAVRELQEYFDGTRKYFSFPLAPEGTSFQRKVWDALLEIPYGKTISYSELAIRLGNLKSIRAVGLANGQNPIAIVIPCHRVIGKDGGLVGYGGGLDNKIWLLRHEGALADQLQLF